MKMCEEARKVYTDYVYKQREEENGKQGKRKEKRDRQTDKYQVSRMINKQTNSKRVRER